MIRLKKELKMMTRNILCTRETKYKTRLKDIMISFSLILGSSIPSFLIVGKKEVM